LTEDQSIASLFAVLALYETEDDSLDQNEVDAAPMSQGLTPDELVELQRRPTVCLPYIPELSAKLKWILNRAGSKTYFKSGKKLQRPLLKKQDSPSAKLKKGVTVWNALALALRLLCMEGRLHENFQLG
jgi:hypothetical protein